MFWAPRDSGPNLYSKMPSISKFVTLASAMAFFAATNASALGLGSPVRLSSE